MKPNETTETIELNELAKYFETHNLTAIKTKWIEDKKTGLIKPHVWTIKRKDY